MKWRREIRVGSGRTVARRAEGGGALPGDKAFLREKGKIRRKPEEIRCVRWVEGNETWSMKKGWVLFKGRNYRRI